MLKCKDIAAKSSDFVDNELSFKGKLEFYLHLMMCVNCRRFIRQFKLMLLSSKHLENEQADEADVESILAHVKRSKDK